jgi:hypothetical protein
VPRLTITTDLDVDVDVAIAVVIRDVPLYCAVDVASHQTAFEWLSNVQRRRTNATATPTTSRLAHVKAISEPHVTRGDRVYNYFSKPVGSGASLLADGHAPHGVNDIQ